MALARGAALALLRHAGKCRRRVALVVVSGRRARVLLHPTTSAARAASRLSALRAQGETPLAHGLVLARRIVRIDRRRSRGALPKVIVISDGHANVPLERGGDAALDVARTAEQLAGSGVHAFVVDTAPARADHRSMRNVAVALGGEYLSLDDP